MNAQETVRYVRAGLAVRIKEIQRADVQLMLCEISGDFGIDTLNRKAARKILSEMKNKLETLLVMV
jgi:hypothetical protein